MTLELEIFVPDGTLLHTRAAAVQAADASGRFGLWPHHERFVTLLAPCLLIYREEGKVEHYAAVDGGVLLAEDDRVSVVTREAVLAERLEDVAAAARAMLAARQAEEQAARAEFAELQVSLLRELRALEHKK